MTETEVKPEKWLPAVGVLVAHTEAQVVLDRKFAEMMDEILDNYSVYFPVVIAYIELVNSSRKDSPC